jgi:hypothetical protein
MHAKLGKAWLLKMGRSHSHKASVKKVCWANKAWSILYSWLYDSGTLSSCKDIRYTWDKKKWPVFIIGEESVRNPDFFCKITRKCEHLIIGTKSEPIILPVLIEVHCDCVVLEKRRKNHTMVFFSTASQERAGLFWCWVSVSSCCSTSLRPYLPSTQLRLRFIHSLFSPLLKLKDNFLSCCGKSVRYRF